MNQLISQKGGLLSAKDLTAEEIQLLFKAAKAFLPLVKEGRTIPLLTGKTVVNLFFENSTRTRLSFELAVRKLGGAVLGFAASNSSVGKGETFIDTAKNILAMQADCFVVRHSCSGSPAFLAKKVPVPVINAGDGFHEHPTQGLLDAFTLQERLGSLKGKNVVIIGDIAHSRVARSNLYILKTLGANVSVCAPPTLLPPVLDRALGVEIAYHPEPLLKNADAVILLRIQLERQNKMQIPSLREYTQFWGMTKERAALLKPSAVILHPGPVNRGVELDPVVADGPRSLILDQVFNGILIRMAVLASLCNPTGLKDFLKKGSK